MIHALAFILTCQLLGEGVTRALSLPVPGPVVGLALLFVALLASDRVRALVPPVADGILRHLSLLFVPAGVGVVGHLATLTEYGGRLALVLVGSTLLALLAGVGAFVAVAHLTGRPWREDHPDA